MVIITVVAVIVSFALIAYRIFVLRILKEKTLMHQLEIQHQQDILKQSIRIQEGERERIAVKLHDDIGNKLNILSVWINNPDSWNSERSKEIIVNQIPELIEATRDISQSLYPVNLERTGLISTIEELITNVESSLKIQLTLIHKFSPGNTTLELQLYRIIQEFLSNALKHSEADKMEIHIRDSVGSLGILLSDNGKGFTFNSIKKGMGLRNIELRLNAINAEYKWKSKTGQGSRLLIKIPKS